MQKITRGDCADNAVESVEKLNHICDAHMVPVAQPFAPWRISRTWVSEEDHRAVMKIMILNHLTPEPDEDPAASGLNVWLVSGQVDKYDLCQSMTSAQVSDAQDVAAS